jgi:hypothetical protein
VGNARNQHVKPRRGERRIPRASSTAQANPAATIQM